MRRLIRRARAARRDQRGYTLIELLMATSVGFVVVGTAVFVFTAGVRSQAGITSRADQIQQARVTMEQIVNEIRQATSAPTATASQLSILTNVDSATCGGAKASTAIGCKVTYSCASGTCTRTEANNDGSGSGSAVQVVTGLATNNVFTYSPSASAPDFVGVRLALAPSAGQGTVTLDDGAAFGAPSS